MGQAFNSYNANTYLLWWMLSLSLIFSLDKNMKIHLSLWYVIIYPILNGAQSNGNSAVSIYEKETNT